MDNFAVSLEKLTSLMNAGLISDSDYATRRKQLVDQFVGVPTGAVARAPSRPPSRGAAIFRGIPRSIAAYGRPPFLGLGLGYPAVPFGTAAAYGAMGFGYGVPGPMAFAFGKGAGARGSPYARPRDPRQGSHAIKVAPLPPSVTGEDLKMLFTQYGVVTLVVLKEGDPRHAYVNFATSQQAAAAAAAGDIVLLGQPANVVLSKRRKPPTMEGEPTDGVGIFNMPFTMTQDEVTAMLSQYPGFHTLKYITGKTGEFRGYCFAYFDSIDNATVAKDALVGLTIGDKVLDVKYSNKSVTEAFAAPVPVME